MAAKKKKSAVKPKQAANKKVAKKPAKKAIQVAPTAPAPVVRPSTAAIPGARTALNPAAAWPFPTGSRP